jgi:hypothetical protein
MTQRTKRKKIMKTGMQKIAAALDRLRSRAQNLTPMENAISDGTHQGGAITRLTDGVISTRYLLMSGGSDASHVTICPIASLPIGVATDESTAAEQAIALETFGASDRTLLCVASAALSANAKVYTAGAGKVSGLPTFSSATITCYEVGTALTAAGADGDVIEIDPELPRKFTIGGNAVTLTWVT